MIPLPANAAPAATREAARMSHSQALAGRVPYVSCLLLGMLSAALFAVADGEPSQKLTHFAKFPGSAMDLVDPASISLPRIDGHHVGYTQSIRVPSYDGDSSGARTRTLTLKTISIIPLVFEVSHFLTPLECKLLRERGIESGLEEVMPPAEPTADFQDNQTDEEMADDVVTERMSEIDTDEDGRISLTELRQLFKARLDTAMTLDDVESMVRSMNMDPNDDGYLDRDEFRVINELAVTSFVSSYHNQVPASRHRYSQQASIVEGDADDWLVRINRRIAKITGIPELFVMKSEAPQVVRYESGGHHHCHLDSSAPSEKSDRDDEEVDEEEDEEQGGGGGEERESARPCCHYFLELLEPNKPCRKCRFATVMFYLSDVTDGGHTSFPAAGNPDIITNISMQREYLASESLCNLTASCGGLTVQPVRGTALIWYNHLPADRDVAPGTTAYHIGQLDHSTMHGDCDVLRGEKWLANKWINYEWYQRDPPMGYGQNWGMEADAPPLPSPSRQIFDAIIGGRRGGNMVEDRERQPSAAEEKCGQRAGAGAGRCGADASEHRRHTYASQDGRGGGGKRAADTQFRDEL